MDITVIVETMLVLFIPILIGYICRKQEVFDEKANKAFSRLMTEVALPCLIFNSVACQHHAESKGMAILIFFISCVVLVAMMLFAMVTPYIFHADSKSKGIYKFITVFNNCTFMGFPILATLFGKQAIFYPAIFNIPHNILVYTVGLYYIGLSATKKQKFSFKKIINTGNVMIILAIICYLGNIKPNGIIDHATSMLGNLTTPLSMVVLGVALAEMHIIKVFDDWKQYVFVISKMLVIPLLIWVILGLFIKNDTVMRDAFVIIAAMPGASVTVTYATQYDANQAMASKYVFLSTLLSIITIPILVFIMSNFSLA